MSRQVLLLVLLLGVLGAVVVYQMRAPSPAIAPPPSSNRAGTGQTRSASAADMLDVRLELLASEPAPYQAPERDPFRFRERRPPPQVAQRQPPPPPPPVPRAAPAEGKPAISSRIRLLGIYEIEGRRVAVLHDGQQNHSPILGVQGDVIEGQYRLLRVDQNAVEMSYLDGSLPQRIPLPGR